MYSTMKSTKKRQYQEDYIQYGFTSIVKNGLELPQCVICYKVLSAEAMKPSFLKRHFNGCHSDLVDKDVAYFKRKEKGIKMIRLDQSGQLSQQNEAGLRASFLVALRIAQDKKAHTIAERLILPSCKDIVRSILGEEAAKRLNSLPLCRTIRFNGELRRWLLTSSNIGGDRNSWGNATQIRDPTGRIHRRE